MSRGMKPLLEADTRARLEAVNHGLPVLTLELMRAAAKDNLLFVTCASWQYYDFALNWANHLRSAGVSNFLIGASACRVLNELFIPGPTRHCFDWLCAFLI